MLQSVSEFYFSSFWFPFWSHPLKWHEYFHICNRFLISPLDRGNAAFPPNKEEEVMVALIPGKHLEGGEQDPPWEGRAFGPHPFEGTWGGSTAEPCFRSGKVFGQKLLSSFLLDASRKAGIRTCGLNDPFNNRGGGERDIHQAPVGVTPVLSGSTPLSPSPRAAWGAVLTRLPPAPSRKRAPERLLPLLHFGLCWTWNLEAHRIATIQLPLWVGFLPPFPITLTNAGPAHPGKTQEMLAGGSSRGKRPPKSPLRSRPTSVTSPPHREPSRTHD